MKRPLKPKPTPNYAAQRARERRCLLLPDGQIWESWRDMYGERPPRTRRELRRFRDRAYLQAGWYFRQGSGTWTAFLANLAPVF